MIPKKHVKNWRSTIRSVGDKRFFCKPWSSADYCKICKATNSL